MGLAERSRSVLHTKLTEVVGDEEAVGDMLSQFPANDLERPATKEFVRAENLGLRAELADLRTDFADLRGDLRADMTERFSAVDVRFRAVDVRISQLEARLIASFHADMVTHLKWIVGLMISAQVLMVAAIALFT